MAFTIKRSAVNGEVSIFHRDGDLPVARGANLELAAADLLVNLGLALTGPEGGLSVERSAGLRDMAGSVAGFLSDGVEAARVECPALGDIDLSSVIPEGLA